MNGTVLVTGGAGFIGSHACKALARAGFLPVTYDSMVRGHQHAVRWGPLEHGDIRDRHRLQSVLARYSPIAVMHFAALALVGESRAQAALYRDVNVNGTAILLDAMSETGVTKIVFSGSCSVYGNPQIVPVTEQAPFDPRSVYAETKCAGERLLQDRESSGLRHVALRYFNAAGADPDSELGEDHEPETHLMPLALLAALGRKPPLVIFGDDYPTPDGTCVRDYVHVSDLADAHVAALTYLIGGGGSAAFNLGAGRGHSVLQVIDRAQSVIGRQIPFRLGPRRQGDPASLTAAIDAASGTLGWRPRYPNLESQIGHAWAWYTRER